MKLAIPFATEHTFFAIQYFLMQFARFSTLFHLVLQNNFRWFANLRLVQVGVVLVSHLIPLTFFLWSSFRRIHNNTLAPPSQWCKVKSDISHINSCEGVILSQTLPLRSKLVIVDVHCSMSQQPFLQCLTFEEQPIYNSIPCSQKPSTYQIWCEVSHYLMAWILDTRKLEIVL